MKRRSLRNGAVVVVTLGTLTGVGTMVASASTRPGAVTASPGGRAGQGRSTTARPVDPSRSPFDPTAGPSSPGPAGSAGSTNACVAVRTIGGQQTGDAQLCTTVRRTGLRVDEVRVSLTVPAGECRDSVTLGVTTQQGGAADTQVVACAGTDRATATFTPDRQVADGSQVCGTLLADDRFAAAQACVRAAA